MSEDENINATAGPLAGTVVSSGEAVSTPAPTPQASEPPTAASTSEEE